MADACPASMTLYVHCPILWKRKGLGAVTQAYNLGAQKAEAGGSPVNLRSA